MQNRKQAIDNISRQLGIIRHDIEQHQAIQDYSLNIHAENFFRGIFNCVYGCHFENANFQSANAACIDLLDTDKKLAYQITSTTSKEKIINTLQALTKPEYQGYEIRVYYLLGKPNLSAKSKQEIQTDFAIDIDEHLFDCSDLIKDINNLETGKLIALNHKCFKETNQVQNDTTVNITGSTVHGPVAVAGQISNSFNESHHHHYAEKADTPIEVDVFHLPEPTTALIGRKKELSQLTEAFQNPNKRLAIIVAAGGIGKSALTDEWLKQIEAHNYYGKTRVFGWSFYSQGSHNTFTNSQPFFSAVLPFLGITEIPKDEIEKARVLVQCLREQPCLLVLDGLEPLQYDKRLPSMNGRLQDGPLDEFISCFRRTAGKSFVLFSSRQPLVELEKWQAEHYLSLDLKTLPHEDGADLLQALGVTGNVEERQAISKDLNGHALSLALMGHLLREHYQGDCRYAKELPPLTSAHGDSDAEKDSRHALRVLDYYDSLQDDVSRCFLQLLGLFDRPMNAAEKGGVIANANHAEPLRALTAKEWKTVELRLEKSGLLLGKKGTFERLEWDTHPIIRAYFGEKFKENYPEAFKQAHLVLFDYYQKLPEKEFPDTLDEMLPLYRAVVHGCWAGEYYEALSDVYKDRILRGDNEYSVKKLGASSQDLTALSVSFQQTWLKPLPDLSEVTQAWLLGQVSFCLMSSGRLYEAYEVREITLAKHKKLENWTESANDAENLTDSALVLGKINKAKESAHYALDCIKYAKNEIKKSLIKPNSCASALLEENLSSHEKDQLTQIVTRTLTCHGRIANVFYYLGDLQQAKQCFEKTELLWQKSIPDFPWLSGSVGAQYCSYLLDTAAKSVGLEHVLARGKYTLEIAVDDNQPFDIARAHLALARIYQAQMRPENALAEFDLAVQMNQKENFIFELPQSYLYRADFYLTQNQLDQAQADLNSAWEIIERCGMKLYAVDYLLIHGRYCLATKDHDTALSHYEEAKQLIQETGYHLRDAELDLFAAKLRQLDLPEHRRTTPGLYSRNADHYLQKAIKRIEEIGQWGLMRVIERDFPENSKSV